ncbi:DUF4974 domain-containing protein [Niastella caeni]|uniref:DUF4974 domain-containing protein n=1 Tax=Niastella caeni TaxID=2569763 RepID=A0A4S8I0M1_9BACT|nr:FecR domain-containing protein [Niastella caeni]THU39202.1 DUF4974 domain-containing protein [Niastella caeni]
MSIDQNTIPHLIYQHIQGELTENEQIVLNEWLTRPENREFFDNMTDSAYQNEALAKMHAHVMDLENGRELVNEKIKRNQKTKRLWTGVTIATIAASILIVLSFALYFWFNDEKGSGKTATIHENQDQLQTDIAPGSSKATLTLADGRQIVLDSMAPGQIAQQGGTDIINNADGQLVYNVTNRTNTGDDILYNTLKTENGQTYRVVLPDESQVWLNAASSINYPVSFSNKERRVKIRGEAFFEIKPLAQNQGEKVPFLVTVEDSAGNTSEEVEVLGTQFNINAYKDEKNITTTLLEGKVRIKNGKNVVLSEPGQQGVLWKATGDIDIAREVNIDKVVAWKKNYFYFDRDSLATVIKQIARWYDVYFVIDKRLSDKTFSGRIMRNMPLSKILEKVEMTSGVKFDIYEGKRSFTISPKP